MSVRDALRGAEADILRRIDDLLDADDAVIVLVDRRGITTYLHGFGMSGCQLEFIGREVEALLRRTGVHGWSRASASLARTGTRDVSAARDDDWHEEKDQRDRAIAGQEEDMTAMTRVLFNTIVCAAGGSPSSANAICAALRLASIHDAETTVLHVAPMFHAPAGSVQRSTPDVFRWLRADARAAAYSGRSVRWTASYGDPPTQIARTVARMGADLAVVGRAPGDSRTTAAIAGQIVRASMCPVLIAPPATGSSVAAPAFRNILCSVSSGLSTRTLQYALSLAQEFESHLTLLNVDAAAPGLDAWLNTDLAHLRMLVPYAADAWCDIEELTTGGDPAGRLQEAAGWLDPDLIVIGAAGGADDALGPVARAALRGGRAHVLVVPAPRVLTGVTTAALDREGRLASRFGTVADDARRAPDVQGVTMR